MAKKPAKTKGNLEKAFAGESQANRRYLAYSHKADDEGFPEVARILRAIGEAETIHALNHLRIMGVVDSTKSNLAKAVEGEEYEVKEMYPEFVKQAGKEKSDRAKKTFSYAMEVEKEHAKILKEVQKMVEQGKDVETKNLMVCPGCGYTMWDKIPDVCPVCGATKDVFEEIE